MGEIISFNRTNLAENFEQTVEITEKSTKRKKVVGSGKKANKRSTAEPIRNPEHLRLMNGYFYDKYLKTNNIDMKHIHLRNHTIFIFGIKTGLRMSDLLRLTWENILSDKVFTIREHKTKKLRDINITNMLRNAALEYKNFYEENHIKFSFDDSVFLEKKWSEILDKDDPDIRRAEKAYIKVLKEAAIKIGITDNIGTHSMRKTYSYWFLLNNKNDPYATSRLQYTLNHDSLKVTLKYSGFSKDEHLKDDENMDSLYTSINNGTVKIYDDKITVSKAQVEELLRYAYELGKEPITDFNTDVDNLATLNGMLADLEL